MKGIRQRGKELIRGSRLPLIWQEKLLFVMQLGYWPDLIHPRTFCEKLHYRKLYVRDDRFVTLSDKILARKYVEATVGPQFLVPLLFSGETILGKDLYQLGNHLAVKRNDDSGSVYFIHENSPEVAERIAGLVSTPTGYGWMTNEWWYQQISPGVLVEMDLSAKNGGERPEDFKFFVFSNQSQEPFFFVEVIRRKRGGITECGMLDSSFNPLIFQGSEMRRKGCLPYSGRLPGPKDFGQMKALALELAREFDFMRVDLYLVDGQVYFGEMTVCPSEGRCRFSSIAFDRFLGSQWRLAKE